MQETTLGREEVTKKIRERLGLPSHAGVYITNTSPRKAKKDWNCYFVKVMFPKDSPGGYALDHFVTLSLLFQTGSINCSQTYHTDCSTCGHASYLTFDVLKSPVMLIDDYVDDP